MPSIFSILIHIPRCANAWWDRAAKWSVLWSIKTRCSVFSWIQTQTTISNLHRYQCFAVKIWGQSGAISANIPLILPPSSARNRARCIRWHHCLLCGSQTYLFSLRPALLGVASLLRGVLPLLISSSDSNTSSSKGSTPSKSLREQQDDSYHTLIPINHQLVRASAFIKMYNSVFLNLNAPVYMYIWSIINK